MFSHHRKRIWLDLITDNFPIILYQEQFTLTGTTMINKIQTKVRIGLYLSNRIMMLNNDRNNSTGNDKQMRNSCG